MPRFIVAALLVLLFSESTFAEPTVIDGTESKTIATCGKGWLEEINGYRVLHLKGTPYEMGFQHGTLLRESVRANFDYLINQKGKTSLVEWKGVKITPAMMIRIIVEIQRSYVPEKYFEELKGLADGADMPLGSVELGNFIPELFHCSGFALMNSATTDGTLLHGRVLDYATDWKLQEHAVLIVAEPDGGIPFVNVSYAGFIGSVTGMNAKHVSIGEMGGGGFGRWAGVPMSFLVREVLENAGSLEDAINVFRNNKRTCEYYYVIADGKSNEAVGMEASWDVLEVVKPGTSHELLPTAVKDCALLSAGERYEELVRRTQAGHGQIDVPKALSLMDRGVAMKSNLHNVLFAPKSTKLWVANAAPDRQPAADQPYYYFQLTDLLQRSPGKLASQPTSVSAK